MEARFVASNGCVGASEEEERGLAAEFHIFFSAFAAIGALIFVLNVYLSFRLFLALQRRQLPRRRFAFILNIALADSLLALCFCAVGVLRSRLATAFNPYVVGRVILVGLSAFSILLYSYTALTILQFAAIRWPLGYQLRISFNACLYVVAGFWMVEIVLLTAMYLYAEVAESKAAILEFTFQMTDLEGVGFFLGSLLLYAATLGALFSKCGGERLPDGNEAIRRRRLAAFLRLGLNFLLFVLCGTPHVVADLAIFYSHFTAFHLASSPEEHRCFLHYQILHRNAFRWLRWMEWGWLLSMLRSLIHPILVLATERVPGCRDAGPRRRHGTDSSFRLSKPLTPR